MAIVGKWKLNEASGQSRIDLSGNGNHLTDVGGVATTLGHKGSSNAAANFLLDGAKYLEITDAAQTGLDVGGIFSFSFMYKPHASIAADILSKSASAGNQRSYLFFQNGASALSMYMSTNGTSYDFAISNITYFFTVGIWYNIQIIGDGVNFKYYAGSKGEGALTLVYTTPFTGALFNSTAPFNVGRTEMGVTANGVIDDLIVANHAFTAEERLLYFTAPDNFKSNRKKRYFLRR